MNKIPSCCPSCSAELVVTELKCTKCSSAISGSFFLPIFAILAQEEGEFLRVFLEARGNIKEIEKRLGISYPTVRGRIDHLIQSLGLNGPVTDARQRSIDILDKLERGEVKTSEALKTLKDIRKEESL